MQTIKISRCHICHETVATIVTVDKAGRIVIPKETRDAQRIRAGTKFLLVEGRSGNMWLQRLDADELAAKIDEELRGANIEQIIAKVKAETERRAVASHMVLRRQRA